MNTAEKNHLEIHLDPEGFYLTPDNWDKDVSSILAQNIGITILSDDHWKVIIALRTHYERFGVAPAIHNVCHSFHKEEKWVHNLFFNCLNAWRVAGLPDPGEEANAYLSDM